MNCPNCGTAEKARVKVCPECNQAYASQDLLELRQLEYLIKETDSWSIAKSTLSKYEIRLEQLRERLTSPTPETEAIPSPEVVKPYVTIENRTRVFGGPGTQYPSFGFITPGKKGKLIGVSRNKKWWVIEVPGSYSPEGLGWIRATELTAINAQGVPIIKTPSIPTCQEQHDQ